MSRSDSVYLQDILECINIVLGYTENTTEFDFTRSIMMQDAVTRRFEIIGEASSRISKEFKKQYPDVQWRLMKDMRNKLAHEYYGVSLHTIFLSVKQDLPILKEQLEKIV